MIEITIGQITIREQGVDGYWIVNADGEGMGIKRRIFEEELIKLFNKLF